MTAIWRQCYTNSEILRYDPERYLEPSRTSAMELFREDSWQLLGINYFRKKLHRRRSTGFWGETDDSENRQICIIESFASNVNDFFDIN